jgi:hypothetical protein
MYDKIYICIHNIATESIKTAIILDTRSANREGKTLSNSGSQKAEKDRHSRRMNDILSAELDRADKGNLSGYIK